MFLRKIYILQYQENIMAKKTAKKSSKKTKKVSSKSKSKKEERHLIASLITKEKKLINKELDILRHHLIICFGTIFILLFLLVIKTNFDIHFGNSGISLTKVLIVVVILIASIAIFEKHRHKKDI